MSDKELKEIARDISIIKGWVCVVGMLILLSVAGAILVAVLQFNAAHP